MTYWITQSLIKPVILIVVLNLRNHKKRKIQKYTTENSQLMITFPPLICKLLQPDESALRWDDIRSRAKNCSLPEGEKSPLRACFISHDAVTQYLFQSFTCLFHSIELREARLALLSKCMSFGNTISFYFLIIVTKCGNFAHPTLPIQCQIHHPINFEQRCHIPLFCRPQQAQNGTSQDGYRKCHWTCAQDLSTHPSAVFILGDSGATRWDDAWLLQQRFTNFLGSFRRHLTVEEKNSKLCLD